MSKRLRVGVTGVGSLLGQGIVRSIRFSKLNVSIVGLCVDKFSTGLYWCDESDFVPYASDSNYVEVMGEKLKRLKIDVLLVGTDYELEKLSKSKQQIEAYSGTKVLVSDPFVVELGDDKYKTARFFADQGLPHPQSAVPENDSELQSLKRDQGFPLIVKPRRGQRSYGVRKVFDDSELLTALESTKSPVVQECVGDESAEYTASGLYFSRHCNAVVVMKRDLRDGNTYRAFTVLDDSLNSWVRKWTEIVKPYGPINFQFRVDAQGLPKVFEINSRFSGTTPLRAKAGFNEVEMCLEHLAYGREIQQPTVQEVMLLRHWEETVVDVSDNLLSAS